MRILSIVTALVLAGPALPVDKVLAQAGTTPPGKTAPAPKDAPKRLSAEDYVKAVAIGDIFEMKSGQMAIEKAAEPDVKGFAGKMIAAHRAFYESLKAAATGTKLRKGLPDAVDPEHQRRLDTLDGKSGAEFEAAYLELQIQAHQEALALHKRFAESGTGPLKDFAVKAETTTRNHLAEVEKLSQKLRGRPN